MSTQREKCLLIAKILNKTRKYNILVGVMREAIRFDANLNSDERKILSRAYKSMINERRNSLRILSQSIEEEEKKIAEITEALTSDNPREAEKLKKEDKLSKLKTLKGKIITEMSNICQEFIELTETKLIAAAVDSVAKIFYYQSIADMSRYLCEFGDAVKDRLAYISKAAEAYNTAMNLAIETFPNRHPIFLKLKLNYSVFLFEIIGKKEDAINLLETTIKECANINDDQFLSDVEISESRILVQLMIDNITIWTRGNIE